MRNYLFEALQRLSVLCESEDIVTDKSVYDIPSYKIDGLTALFNKWKKKEAQIDFEIVNKWYNNVTHTTFYKIKVSGGYKLENWELAGVIEHSAQNDGSYYNIIREMPDFIGKIPEKFRAAAPHCDHCKTERFRNDTYIVFNNKTNEFKQVGRNCLQEYTGFDAKTAAANAAALSEFHDFQEMDDDEFSGGSEFVFSPDDIKCGACAVVNEKGYDTDRFISNLTDMLAMNSIKSMDKEDAADKVHNKYMPEVKKIDEWVSKLDTSSNGYLQNAYAAWNKHHLEVRDFKLIGSLISFYYKEHQKASNASKPSSYKEGDKITLTVESSRVLYSKGSYAYKGPETLVYRIVDTKGTIFIWSTTSRPEKGDVISASVKNPDKEYNGEHQVEITRGKIESHSSSAENPVNDTKQQKENNQSPIDSLEKDIDLIMNTKGVYTPQTLSGPHNSTNFLDQTIWESRNLKKESSLTPDEKARITELQYKLKAWMDDNPEIVKQYRETK